MESFADLNFKWPIDQKGISSYKYLGMYLDEQLHFKQHIEHFDKETEAEIRFLFFRNKSCFSKSVRNDLVRGPFKKKSVLDS